MNLRNLFWDTRDLGELFDLSQRPAIYLENSIGLAIRAGILGVGLPALAMYMVWDEFQKNGFAALSPIIVTEQHPHHLRIRLPREGLEWLKNQILVKLVV